MILRMDDKKRHGAEATSREFARYDQVRKPQSYHLAEQDGTEAFDDEYRIRSCDIGRFLHGDAADRRTFAQELGAALQDIGFAILVGHDVDPSLYDDIQARVAEMFTRTPLDQKLRFRAQRHGSINQGYFPILETSDIHPDLVEGWVFCRRAFDLPDRLGPEQGSAAPAGATDFRAEFWPDPKFEPIFRRLVVAHERLVLPVMQSLLAYLEHDPHLYDERLTRTNFGFRLNYYPPLATAANDTRRAPDRTASPGAPADEPGAARRPRSGRLLGHEDVGMFTFLPAPAIEGLQVLNRRNMKWVRLEAPRGSLVLNTGDYMQRITNDILPSTTHRVSAPRDAALRAVERISFPMNIYLWEDERLEVLPHLADPKYAPVRAIEFHTRSTSKFYGDDYAVTE